MKISSILRERRTLSFEVFPPKPEHDEDLSGIKKTLEALTFESPDFVSVTYGAGGHNRPRALEIAEIVLKLGMTPLSHLTAVGYTKEDTVRVTSSFAKLGVENVLALRGDVPADMNFPQAPWIDFRYALNLMEFIGSENFCLGGAAYPEKHPESEDLAQDIEVMRRKENAGVCFFVTQLFFDNGLFSGSATGAAPRVFRRRLSLGSCRFSGLGRSGVLSKSRTVPCQPNWKRPSPATRGTTRRWKTRARTTRPRKSPNCGARASTACTFTR